MNRGRNGGEGTKHRHRQNHELGLGIQIKGIMKVFVWHVHFTTVTKIILCTPRNHHGFPHVLSEYVCLVPWIYLYE